MDLDRRVCDRARRSRDARFGRAVRAEDMTAGERDLASGPHAWLALDGALVAVGERTEEGTGRVVRVSWCGQSQRRA